MQATFGLMGGGGKPDSTDFGIVAAKMLVFHETEYYAARPCYKLLFSTTVLVGVD